MKDSKRQYIGYIKEITNDSFLCAVFRSEESGEDVDIIEETIEILFRELGAFQIEPKNILKNAEITVAFSETAGDIFVLTELEIGKMDENEE